MRSFAKSGMPWDSWQWSMYYAANELRIGFLNNRNPPRVTVISERFSLKNIATFVL